MKGGLTWRVFVVTVLVSLLLANPVSGAVPTGPPAGVDATSQEQIEVIEVEQAAAVDGNTTYVWKQSADGQQVESYRLEVHADADGDGRLCLYADGTENCTRLENGSAATFTVPASGSAQTLTLSLEDPDTGETQSVRTVTLDPIARTGDLDRDGLTNEREVSHDTDLMDADTDGDGLVDGREVVLGTDPTSADVGAAVLNHGREDDLGADLTGAVTDGDGIADGDVPDLGSVPTEAGGDADGRESSLATDSTSSDSDAVDPYGGREARELHTEPLATTSDGSRGHAGSETGPILNPTSPVGDPWIGGAIVGLVAGIGLTTTAISRGWVIAASDGLRSLAAGLGGVGEDVVEVYASTEAAVSTDGDGPGDASDHDSAAEVFEHGDERLVEDGEIVTRMLDAEGGRMRQSDIVDTTTWSKAKVSRLLSRLADDREVVKVRLGRENLVCLEDARPPITEQVVGGDDPGTTAPGAGARGA